MFIPLVKKDYKWSAGLGDGGGVFWGMFIHCPGEKAQVPSCCLPGLSLMLPCPVSSLYHSPPLPSRVAWTILKYLEFSKHYCLCMHMYPSPECSLPSNFPICFDLTPCAAFLVYLPQVSSPWVAQGPFPLLCSSVLIPLSSTSYIDIHLLICSATTWVLWGYRAPYLARENYLWEKCHGSPEAKSKNCHFIKRNITTSGWDIPLRWATHFLAEARNPFLLASILKAAVVLLALLHLTILVP